MRASFGIMGLVAVGAWQAQGCVRDVSPAGTVAVETALHAEGRPSVGAEVDLEAPVYTEHRRVAKLPAVAESTDGFLAVWRDNRNGPSNQEVWDIYGTRVSRDGRALDPLGIRLTDTQPSENQPAVAWNGRSYLVVWYQTSNREVVRGTRVNTDGKVLDPTGLDFGTRSVDGQREPLVVADGTNFLVAWTETRVLSGGLFSQVYGTRVLADGTIEHPGGVPLASGEGHHRARALAWNGSEYLLVWSGGPAGQTRYYANRLGRDGTVSSVGSAPLTDAETQLESTALAWNGAHYLLAWAHDPTPFNPAFAAAKVFGRRLDARGTRLEEPVLALGASKWAGSIQAAWTGAQFVVAWSEGAAGQPSTVARRVNAAGQLLDPGGPIPLPTSTDFGTFYPRLAWDGTSFLLVLNRSAYWFRPSEGLAYDPDGIFSRRLDGDLKPREPALEPLSTEANEHRSLALAATDVDYLLVYRDDRNRDLRGRWGALNGDTYGARVTPAAGGLEVRVAPLASTSDDEFNPAVSWNGQHHLVQHTSFTGADAASRLITRVGRDGKPLGTSRALPDSFEDSTLVDQAEPVMAWNGSVHLLVWRYGKGTGNSVYARRLSPAGEPLDAAPIAVALQSSSVAYGPADLRVEAAGDDFLVVWRIPVRKGSADDDDLWGNIVTGAGAARAKNGFPIDERSGHQRMPAIASDGGSFLVLWQDVPAGGASRVYAARVDRMGG